MSPSNAIATNDLEHNGPAGECPNCSASVEYDAWVPIDGEFEMMGCPACRRATRVDAVYPPA